MAWTTGHYFNNAFCWTLAPLTLAPVSPILGAGSAPPLSLSATEMLRNAQEVKKNQTTEFPINSCFLQLRPNVHNPQFLSLNTDHVFTWAGPKPPFPFSCNIAPFHWANELDLKRFSWPLIPTPLGPTAILFSSNSPPPPSALVFSLSFFTCPPANSGTTTFFYFKFCLLSPVNGKHSTFTDHFFWSHSPYPPFLLDHSMTQHSQPILFCNLLFLWFWGLDQRIFQTVGDKCEEGLFKVTFNTHWLLPLSSVISECRPSSSNWLPQWTTSTVCGVLSISGVLGWERLIPVPYIILVLLLLLWPFFGCY